MTQLMGRPILEVPGELGARPALADLLAGVRTALVGLAAVGVPVLGLWVATPYADDGATGATRLAGALWLLGHGAPLLRGSAGAPLTVTPLLIGLLAVVQLFRAGARVSARRGLRSWWGGPVAVWAGYCGVAVAVVVHCAGAGLFRTRVLPDVLAVGLLAAFAVTAGARSTREVRETDEPYEVHEPYEVREPYGPYTPYEPHVPDDSGVLGTAFASRLLDRLPERARPADCAETVRRAALAAGAGLVAAGGVLVAVAAVSDAVTGGGRGMAVLGRGPTAVLGLVLLAVVLLPNAVLWGAAYALGPGFAVGEGTAVAPGGTALGPVPDFPLFALLPESGPGGWRLAAIALPALAGVVPAVLLGRAAARRAWYPAATAVAAVLAALLTGAAAAALGWLSGGALAGGRMARLGPVPWWAGLAAAGWFVVVVVPGALLVRLRALGPAARTPGAGVLADLAGHARRTGWQLRARAHAAVLRLSGSAPEPSEGVS
ncbi:DUF6350 family protein [Streptomyces sp. SP17BM10]|uniref:cell division protein PerM n=1 Tax=Streptomyces sp. SP17BM10 TaxID=3002530 RepID=UPI002E771CB3|nr:DUF6350 family protein [Streptomyces sp. SP17BM10]MEE1784348.1 DUF6350 family protein [Streptomyces sp. SP17BM10]